MPGKVFGPILVTYEEGRLKDSYDNPDYRAEEVKEQPYFAGLDIIWNMVRKGNKWKKGKIGPFGRNQAWLSATSGGSPFRSRRT